MIIEKPYIENGLSVTQNHLRSNHLEYLEIIKDKSSNLSTDSELLGFADNGISAVICFIKENGKTYAVKIKPLEKSSTQFDLLKHLNGIDYKHSIKQFEQFTISVNSDLFSVQILEYIDAERASHSTLSNNQEKTLMKELGKALAELHAINVIGYGELKEMNSNKAIVGQSSDILKVLGDIFENNKHINKFSTESSVLCHHALGLHNVFYTDNKIKIFDFKPLLLPREFDLAMVYIWNIWRGKELMNMFLDEYSKEHNYSQQLFETALLLEYKSKLKQWEKRLKNNPKVQAWIQQGEKEIARLEQIDS